MATNEAGARARARILDASLSIASAEGLSALTTRRVAQEAGVNVGLLHYYFGSKERLVEETLRRFGEDMRLLLERISGEHADEGPEERLVAMLLSAFETARLRPGLIFGFLSKIVTALEAGDLSGSGGKGLPSAALPVAAALRAILEGQIFPLLALRLGGDQLLVRRRSLQMLTSIFHPVMFTPYVPFVGVDMSTREGRLAYIRGVVQDALTR